MKFLKPITKVTKTIILGVGTAITIGFAAMWGVAANQTYEVSTNNSIGIGSKNYNKKWTGSDKDPIDTKKYKSYDDFIAQINKGSNQGLKDAVNSNHTLWISGIVLTSIGIATFGVGCYLLMFTEDKDADGEISRKLAMMQKLEEEYDNAVKELEDTDEDCIILKEEIKEE